MALTLDRNRLQLKLPQENSQQKGHGEESGSGEKRFSLHSNSLQAWAMPGTSPYRYNFRSQTAARAPF